MGDDYYCESILSGRVPVRVVAETDNVLAFHHVFQSWDIHIVVIPEQRFDESNYKVITNGGSYQSNQHLHIHLVSGKPLTPEYPAAKGELAV
jgi:histidine triad (HIT) family protein